MTHLFPAVLAAIALTVGLAGRVAAEGPPTPAATSDELRKQLAKPVEIEKPFDGDMKDILEYLSDKYSITFIIDPVAFKNADPPIDNVESTKVKLPKLPEISLHAILRLLLDPIGGTYFARRDYVEITTPKVLQEKFGYEPRRQLRPENACTPLVEAVHLGERVHVVAKEQPFADAVREIADTTGANIVIDVRAKELAKKPITATLQQAPLRTALRVLADMVELKVVAMDNILYITTPENAEKLLKEEAARPRPEPAPAPTPEKTEAPPAGAKKVKS
ncbi:MAG: hypothetical protein ACJ8F7_22200 [Gemmataceae bacterium]